MWPKYPVRLGAIGVLSVALAVVIGLVSLSNTKFADDPKAAIALNPYNGPALANYAFDGFNRSVQDWTPTDTSDPQVVAAQAMAAISKAAQNASYEAQRAYQREPLSPKAHTILALAAPNLETKHEVIDIASRLNKRELVLQGLLLEKHIAEGSYPKAIETLDQTLRAHPEVSNRFFPSLVEVLTLDATLPQFVELFANPLPWRQQFLNFALRDKRALTNLAVLRARVVLDDKNFDKRLIARLIEQGDVDGARAVHRVVRPDIDGKSQSGRLDWLSDYPPLEWHFASERGFRADLVDGGSALMVDVAPGGGGVLAYRLIQPPSSRFFVRINHDLQLERRSDQVRLRLRCLSTKQAALDQQLSKAKEQFVVDTSDLNCDAYLLEIAARVWTESVPLKGRVLSVSVDK